MKKTCSIFFLIMTGGSILGMEQEMITDITETAPLSKIGTCTVGNKSALYRLIGTDKARQSVVAIKVEEKIVYGVLTGNENNCYTITSVNNVEVATFENDFIETKTQYHYLLNKRSRQRIEQYLGHRIAWSQ